MTRANLPPCRRRPASSSSSSTPSASRGERWFGWRGTCLVKALVLSALLADHDGVELVIGIRRGEGEAPIDGHAWIRVGVREFSLLGPAEAAGEGYVTMTALPVSAPR